jgi:hypothetical protein
MVVDLKKLSDALGRSSPEEDLRRDLQRIIRARKPEIEETLATGKSFVLRVCPTAAASASRAGHSPRKPSSNAKGGPS